MSRTAPPRGSPLEIWGGIECTVNRVGDRWHDQLARSGHDDRAEDLDRIARLGITSLRYPVLWERLAPSGLDDIDWTWSDARLAALRAHGIRPIVGLLHHGSGPSYTDLLDDAFPEKLARYAGAVAARYPWVTDFTPVNEPLTTARFSALYGHWFPHRTDDRSFARALFNQLRGVVLAMRAIRAVTPDARLVQTEDCGRTFGTAATAAQVSFEAQRRWMTFDLLCGRVDRTHPIAPWLRRAGISLAELDFFALDPCPPDVLGLNYYVTSDRLLDHRLDGYPAERHGGNGHLRYVDIDAVRIRPEGILGHEAHLLDAWQRYGIRVAVTEVHLGCTREEQVRWLVESWHAAHAARARGAEVQAITAWALFGSFDWDSLVTRDAGRYEPGAFDVRADPPRRTALGDAVSALTGGSVPAHPALAGPGWWARPERLLAGTAAGRQHQAQVGPPLLVIGASGTLGRAFQRIAMRRGLAAHVTGRPELDVTDPVNIDLVLRRVKPWAVVNAAGYVRVDRAESEPETCHRLNVGGAVNVAAACRRHGLPFVTFSSDLVFDGEMRRAYGETDAPRPLNVYGASKAEAERRVLELLPGALVVRTSAFFGPWDEANFVTAMLRTIDAGEPFFAPADSSVSPTYVPDLVDATLDLLIDAEHGLWHLANADVLTWFDFALRAAEVCGRSTELIVAAPTTQVWAPARRPAFSALASSRGQVMRGLQPALIDFAEAYVGNGAEMRSCASP